jgi:hypothetical protein
MTFFAEHDLKEQSKQVAVFQLAEWQGSVSVIVSRGAPHSIPSVQQTMNCQK